MPWGFVRLVTETVQRDTDEAHVPQSACRAAIISRADRRFRRGRCECDHSESISIAASVGVVGGDGLGRWRHLPSGSVWRTSEAGDLPFQFCSSLAQWQVLFWADAIYER
jgi:hypothetical protein